MAEVSRWVADELYNIIGLSDKCIAEFLISLATKSSTATDFVQRLRDTKTVDISQPMIAFAQQLWGKVPHKQVQEKPARVAERVALEVQKRSQNYRLVSDDEEEVQGSN